MALGNNIKRDRLIPNNDNKPLFEEEKEDGLLRFFEKNREKSKPETKFENIENFEKKSEIKLPINKETKFYKDEIQINNQLVSQNKKQILISQDDFSELNLFASELVSQSNYIKKNLTEITEDFAEISEENNTENSLENNLESGFNVDFNTILQNLEQNERELLNTNKAFNLLNDNKLKALATTENAEKSLDTFVTGISEVQKTSRILAEISSQSGALAINAAIEAARVGEAGRGFVVIADEIRKISDNAKKSSENIEDALRGLQKDMQLALKALFQMKNYLENQDFATNQLAQNIENITQNNTNIIEMVKISQRESKENKNSEKYSEKAKNIGLENTKKITKKPKDISEKLENINHTAQNLHSIAKQLNENLKNID